MLELALHATQVFLIVRQHDVDLAVGLKAHVLVLAVVIMRSRQRGGGDNRCRPKAAEKKKARKSPDVKAKSASFVHFEDFVHFKRACMVSHVSSLCPFVF